MDAWDLVPVILRDAIELAEVPAWAVAPIGFGWMGEECGEFDRRAIPSSTRVRNSSLVGISFSGGNLRAWA